MKDLSEVEILKALEKELNHKFKGRKEQIIKDNLIRDLREKNEFICPNCGKRTSVKDGSISAVLVKEDSQVTFRGNRYVDTIKSSYASVRFCQDCKNVRKRNKLLRHISYFTIFPVLLLIIISLLGGNNPFYDFSISSFIKSYFIFVIILFVVYVPVVKFYREMLSPLLNKSILKRAKEGNAL